MATPRSAPAPIASSTRPGRGEQRHGDGDDRRHAAGEGRLRGRRAPQHPGQPGDAADDSDPDARRRRRHVEHVEQRSGEQPGEHEQDRAECAAEQSDRDALAARRTAWYTEGDEHRVDRGDESEHPQPRTTVRRRPSSAASSTTATVRSRAEMACCWSSMRVTPSTNHAPSTRVRATAQRPPPSPTSWASIASAAMHAARSATGARIPSSRASA